MESWKPKVTKSKLANAPNCKKHPKHTQSPGVCSICLGEKLSQLSSCSDYSSSSSKGVYSSSSSSSSVSSLSSSEASSCSSPMANYTWRVGMEGRNSMKVFMKSRSMALVAQDHENEKKINGGFWSKLLPRSTNRKILMHSTTMQIERVITAVH